VWAVHGLCRALAARGHDVTVFTTNVDGEGESAVPVDAPVPMDGVTVRYFRVGRPRRLFRSPAMARRLREEIHSFDVVHVHSSFIWPPWAAAREARRAGRPYLFTPHGMLVPRLIRERGRWRKTVWVRLLEGSLLRQAAGIHVTSRAEAADVAALGFGACRFYLVPFGVEVDDTPAEPALPPRVLFLGRISWKKGLGVLVDAMAGVPGAELVVAGNDDEGLTGRLRERAAARGLAGRVRFVGPVYGEAKAALLRSAAVFALPSKGENFAVAALEAMAVGLPVVLSEDVGLAADVIESGAGLAVPASPEAVAGALRRVLETPGAREVMGAAGRHLARERFSWESVAARMEDVLREVIERPCTATR
jgi:glycosyltransferase involved in cell wall biosynthesis